MDSDGGHVLVNTAGRRQKIRNLRRDKPVAVNLVDPANAGRLGTIRGRVVEIAPEGADGRIDWLAKTYPNVDEHPFRTPAETRVTVRIAPEHPVEMGLE